MLMSNAKMMRVFMTFANIRKARNTPEKRRKVALTDGRIASLDALGFDWKATREYAAKKSFAQRVDELRAYKEKYGHIYVKKSDDKSLYNFVRNMRQALKNPGKSKRALTDDCIERLGALGFEWTPERGRKPFDQRIADLQAYKEKNGHIKVKRSDDTSLYAFCCDIRYARNNPEKSTLVLADDRIASLDALGFDWRMS